MSGSRYERVSTRDVDNTPSQPTPISPTYNPQHSVPSSPPPSFHSRSSSQSSTRLLPSSEQDRTLADTFGGESDSDDDTRDDPESSSRRQRGRMMNSDPFAANHVRDRGPLDASNSSSNSGNASTNQGRNYRGEDEDDDEERPPVIERRVTQWPIFSSTTTTTASRVGRGGGSSNDGVFANMSAKPGVGGGEDGDEKPPTYEQAAADAAPPYWETTILAPGYGTDEVYIDGLPVGSLFSFMWNGLISMSFHFVGFLLTYLLHTTHAAKNGSRAGLGITLIQYGFTLGAQDSATKPPTPAEVAASLDEASSSSSSSNSNEILDPDTGITLLGDDRAIPADAMPAHPNAHTFNDAAAAVISAASSSSSSSSSSASSSDPSSRPMVASDWFAYALMIVGWFLLIRALSDYIRARKHEKLVLQSPDRVGAGVTPVVVEGEDVERVV